MSYQYFELELPNGDLYKGELFDSSILKGLALYQKKNKLIMIGNIDNGVFNGHGVCLDISEQSVYYGTIKNSMKDGIGMFQKHKSLTTFNPLIKIFEQCNKNNYKRLISDQLEKAKQESENVKSKIKKYQQLFMSAPLKELLKKIKYSMEELEKKKKKRMNVIEQYQVVYKGEFNEDKRQGWGINIYRNGDCFKGQFENDQMEGRGIYLFNSLEQNSVLYVGDMKQNAFQGLGKMQFKDDTQYFGSFNNNCMQSVRALIKFGNDDKFKGGVSQNVKHGEGCSYVYSNGDTYEGGFKGDKKEGQGKLQIVGCQVQYEGDFKNDIKDGKCTKYNFGNAFGSYSGDIKNEMLDGNGKFEFPMQKMIYEGEFKENLFNGRGKITHTDTGNIYEGEFYEHHKDGPCTFTLKNGQRFKGRFEANEESMKGADYGKRF